MNENEVLPHTQMARKDKKEETRRKALTGTNLKGQLQIQVLFNTGTTC